jgi:ERF superfamily
MPKFRAAAWRRIPKRVHHRSERAERVANAADVAHQRWVGELLGLFPENPMPTETGGTTSMLEMSAQINELATALAKAQGTIGLAAKDAENPFFHSMYASLAAIRETIRVPLANNGLAYVQAASTNGARVTVQTMLLHTSGQFIKAELTLQAKDDGPQSIGSAISYGKRYLLAAMTGVVAEEEDDDGEAASARPAPARPTKSRPAPKPPEAAAGLTTPQRKKLFATAREHGWTNEEVKAEMERAFGCTSTHELHPADLDQLLNLLQRRSRGATTPPSDDEAKL